MLFRLLVSHVSSVIMSFDVLWSSNEEKQNVLADARVMSLNNWPSGYGLVLWIHTEWKYLLSNIVFLHSTARAINKALSLEASPFPYLTLNRPTETHESFKNLIAKVFYLFSIQVIQFYSISTFFCLYSCLSGSITSCNLQVEFFLSFFMKKPFFSICNQLRPILSL